MTEREKELMKNPAEEQTFVDPAEPKATTAFRAIAIVVAILAVILVVVVLMLYR